jgi:oxaloacetate decarboxylase alpha subunit
MLTNMESQLKEQGAADKLDAVLEEIPRVREDLGLLPLVTPTSQIVGTQAVLNILAGERYKNITKETRGVLRGEYGVTPAPMNAELQQRVLEDGEEVITCRPADLLVPEMDKLTEELETLANEKSLDLAKNVVEDVLTYALFPQIGLKFIENRNNPDAFEPVPSAEPEVVAAAAPAARSTGDAESYTVTVNGTGYAVTVSEGGVVQNVAPVAAPAPVATGGAPVNAPLAGNIFKILVGPGEVVSEGDVVMIMEAMKMETEIRTPNGGTISSVKVKEGDAVQVGDLLLTLG